MCRVARQLADQLPDSGPAFRAASQAALNVYQAIRTEGTQKSVVATMQTRMDLYDFLGYHDYERKLDELFKNEESREAL